MTLPADLAALGAPALPAQAASAPAWSDPLPAHSRALDVASFERLYAQAHEQQAALQLANPAQSMAHQSIGGVTRAVSATSREYLGTVDAGIASLQKLDLQDPRTLADVMHHFTAVSLQSVQLTTMLGEVSSAKKSLQELFHNQG